jgi:hypothetical protein
VGLEQRPITIKVVNWPSRQCGLQVLKVRQHLVKRIEDISLRPDTSHGDSNTRQCRGKELEPGVL